MYLFDGEKDHLDSMVPAVKNALNTTYGSLKKLKEKMSVVKSDTKIIVIMLESYVSKGPDFYDLQDPKIRKGYGTVKVSLAPRDLNKSSLDSMFKTNAASTSATPSPPAPPELSPPEEGEAVQPPTHGDDVADGGVKDDEHEEHVDADVGDDDDDASPKVVNPVSWLMMIWNTYNLQQSVKYCRQLFLLNSWTIYDTII